MTAHARKATGMGVDRDEFARLLSEHERGLRAYILAMAPRWSDADEIFQSTCLRLWEEVERFEPGTSFGAWSAKVAYYEVLSLRKQQQRERLRLTFSGDFVDVIGTHGADYVEPTDTRQALLRDCLAELSPEQQKLIRLRYVERRSIASIAAHIGKSVEATYKTLSRIRRVLHECVQRKQRGRAQT